MPEPSSRPVLWTRAAGGDLEAIVTYIAADSPAAAHGLLAKIRKRADTLCTAPERGRVVPELSRMGIRTFREISVRPYRLMYRVEKDRVIVLAVFDGRRDLEEILLERLVRV